MTKIDQVKEYLADEKQRIRLHDVVSQETRAVLSATSEDSFPVSATWSEGEFSERLARYENLTSDLTSIQAILGYWGQAIHQDVLTLAPKRIMGRLTISGGLSAWLGLRWYPILLLIYNGGIGAVAAGRYENLKALLLAPAPDTDDHRKAINLTVALNRGLSDLRDAFKTLPGMNVNTSRKANTSLNIFSRNWTIFFSWVPTTNSTLINSKFFFHSFMRSAQYSAFLGRFAWKFSSRGADSPFTKLIAEADEYGDTWPPLQAGLFGGSHKTFTDAANNLTMLLKQLNWW